MPHPTKKTLNPAIKLYTESYHCVRGGEKQLHEPEGNKAYLFIYLSTLASINRIYVSFVIIYKQETGEKHVKSDIEPFHWG